MAKTQNISPPPPPPAPVAPAPPAPADSAPGTEPDATNGAVPPVPPAPPAPEVPTGEPASTNTSPTSTQDGTDNVQTGPGEIDGGAPEQPVEQQKVDGANGPVTADAELHGGVKASDYQQPRTEDEEFGDIDPKLTETMRADEIARRGFKAGRAGRPLGTRRKRFTDNEWSRYQAGYENGKRQGEVDELSTDERLERLERASGLPVPGAEIYGE